MRHYSKGKVGRRTATPSAQDLGGIARRMGEVLAAFHASAMSALIAADKQGLAEEFNDVVKPVVDYLRGVYFVEDEDEIPKDPTA